MHKATGKHKEVKWSLARLRLSAAVSVLIATIAPFMVSCSGAQGQSEPYQAITTDSTGKESVQLFSSRASAASYCQETMIAQPCKAVKVE